PCVETGPGGFPWCGRCAGHDGDCALKPCARGCQSGALPDSDFCGWCVATWRTWVMGEPAAYVVPIAAWERQA
ncbi:MAG: hypothetical protein ACK4N5_09485, partial [Myxococcales bacterium]